MPKIPINIDDVAEVVTAVVMKYSVSPVNFDSLYAFISYYVAFADQPTLEGLTSSIRLGADVGAQFDDNLVLPGDIFN